MAEETKLNDNNTTTTLSVLNDGMDRFVSFRKKKKLISLSLAGILALLLGLYFLLPCFQSSNCSFIGMTNFQSQELVSLSGLDHYQVNLNLDSEAASENLKNNSLGLIREASFDSNGFTASANIVETIPLATYQSVSYFSDGESLEEILTKVSKLSLDESSQGRLSLNMKKECENLPSLHFPKSITPDTSILTEAVSYLECLDYDSLSCFVGFQFKKLASVVDSKDEHWCHYLEAVFIDNSNYYLLQDLKLDSLSSYFKKDFLKNSLLPALRQAVLNKKDITIKDYQFEDDSTHTYSVYPFTAEFDDDTVVIYPSKE